METQEVGGKIGVSVMKICLIHILFLGTPSGEVPITEVNKIISLANDSSDVTAVLRNYISQGKTSRLFDLLSDLYEELSENGVHVLGHSLLEVKDNIQEPRTAFDFGSVLETHNGCYTTC
ncbi:MAG: hypothetical protein IPP55_09500 [Anaerolineales bacterium]|nr:hypothetical protein [Anaerolineales bacterium]